MKKSIAILIGMCKGNKEKYSANELATFLNLKFTEGVYPHLRKLEQQQLIIKIHRGEYVINKENLKIQTIIFFIKLFGDDAKLLFSDHTKRILQKFSVNPILKATELPYNNLKTVKHIAKKTKIIHSIEEKNSALYFLMSWEEPTMRLLQFFDIKLQFDEEDHKHKMIKFYSADTTTQAHLTRDEKTIQRAGLNMQAYLEGKEFILDKLRNSDIPEFGVLQVLTRKKISELINPFEITRKINDWKIKYVYNTDRIEGNPLTMEDVRTILTMGMDYIKKEKKAVLETVNSRLALDNIFDTANDLTVEFIKKLHLITQQGIDVNAGSYKSEENCVVDDAGNLIDTTTPFKFVEERMNSLLRWYHENKDKIHPVALASVFHNQFVYIHPFSDGNGRVARLLFNFILIKRSYIPIIFFNDLKHKYYSALRQAKSGDIKPFLHYVADLYREQLDEF